MAMNEIKNYGHSVRARLLNLAKNENQQYQLVLTRYLQERLLYRLAHSRYRENFILKGGALLFAHERFTARPTLDIDFMGTHIDNDRRNIKESFSEVCKIECSEDAVVFHVDTMATYDIAVEKRYPGVRITVTATLDTIRQDVSMDIGFGDIVVPAPVILDYPTLLDSEERLEVLAYSIETVIAEKFQTAIERGEANSRMKDFYDLYTLLETASVDPEVLKEAIATTFANRQTVYSERHPFFNDDFGSSTNLNTRWNAFVKKIKSPTAKPFDEVMATLRSHLAPYWEMLKEM